MQIARETDRWINKEVDGKMTERQIETNRENCKAKGKRDNFGDTERMREIKTERNYPKNNIT